MSTPDPTWKDWTRLALSIALGLYFLIAAYGRYRTMFPRQ